MNKMIPILIIGIIMAIGLVTSVEASVWDYLTKGRADTLYCPKNGVCTLSAITVNNLTVGNLFVGNLTVSGEYINITVTNYNITGDIDLDGCINFSDGTEQCTAQNTSFNESLLEDYVPYTGATGDVDLGIRDLSATDGNFTDDLEVGSTLTVLSYTDLLGNLDVYGLTYFRKLSRFFQDVTIYNDTDEVILEMESGNASEGVELRLLQDGTNDLYIYTYGSNKTGNYYGLPRNRSSYVDARGARFILGTFDTSPMYLATSQDIRWEISGAGDLTPYDDEYYDIGNTSNRIRDIYVLGEDDKGGLHFVEDDGTYGNLSMNDDMQLLWNGRVIGNASFNTTYIDDTYVTLVNWEANNDTMTAYVDASAGGFTNGSDIHVGSINGTSGNFTVISGTDINITGNISFNPGTDMDQEICFYNGGSECGDWIRWNDVGDNFFFSDTIYSGIDIQASSNIIAGGNFYTSTGDIWAGSTSITTAEFSVKSTGVLNATNATFKGSVTAHILNGTLGWKNLSDYPTGCSDGEYLYSLGDTLTCGTPPDNDTGGSGNSSQEMIVGVNNSRINASHFYSINCSAIKPFGGADSDFCTDADTYNSTVDFVDTFMNRTDFTTIDDYPTNCTAGTYVVGFEGDTLLCGTPPDNDSGSSGASKWLDKGTFLAPNETFAKHVTINGTLNAISLNGTLGWVNLSDYPTGCIDGEYLVTIGDTLTCGTPPDNDTGGGSVNGTDINVKYINATSINTTQLQLHTGTAADGDQYIYFFEDNNEKGEYFGWYNAGDEFYFTDKVYVDGPLSTSGSVDTGGDLVTTGVGDDLWLGTTTQAWANFRAYANGDLYFNKLLNGSIGWGNLTYFPTNCTDGTYVVGFDGNSFLCGTPPDNDTNTYNSTADFADSFVNRTGDSMTGDLSMALDKKYKWADESYIMLESATGDMIFQLGI